MIPPAVLTRHAVCFGSTGSGKTGLCLAVLEDLAAAGVPVVAIDPKGDLANLLLVPTTLEPREFEPWIDPAEATRRGTTPAALAAEAAATWRKGLTDRGIGPTELAAWKAKVDVRVLTPGSDTAPVDMVSSLTRCPHALRHDPEGLRAWITGAVGSLLDLVGRPSNPLTDPEAILLAHLFGEAFAAGEDLPFDVLLPRVVDPPFARLGYFPVDEVLSARSRRSLALDLNDLVASPAFQPWRHGEPLDLDAWTAPVGGRTPIRVLSLSHLSDAERMFFVGVLLHATVAWTRRLPGTGELRALLYLDEAVGFLPPHPKEPPSKGPMLTLLKQARAVGVGVMLATQNPVDLDHKAISNANTWLVGRLQSENDRARVLDTLTASGRLSRRDAERRLAALPARHFLVRDPEGRVGEIRSLHTRCYLRGPLTRHELLRLLRPDAEATAAPVGPPVLDVPPPVPAVPVRWLSAEAAAALPRAPSATPGVRWRLGLYARLRVGADTLHRLWLDGTTHPLALDDASLSERPPAGGGYPPLPADLGDTAAVARLVAGWREGVGREAALEVVAAVWVPGG